jgi:hypothetical protein
MNKDKMPIKMFKGPLNVNSGGLSIKVIKNYTEWNGKVREKPAKVYLSMPRKKQDSRKNGGKNMGRASPAEFIRETAVMVRGSVRLIAPRREYGNVSGLCT